MITINNLTKVFAKTGKRAADNVSLQVNAGEIFGFLGPNGAGKSTTIKCMTGIIPFDEGSIQICGHDIISEDIKAKSCIGFVPDNHMVYDKLSGKEYAYFMADIYGVSLELRKERLDNLTKLFELTEAINNPINSYSHGMKQKISIIGALIHAPKVWVLDEPLTGLDPKSAYLLKELMREHVKKGNCVFFSSHVLDVVEKLCDRIAIINNGQIIAVCTLDELKEKRKDMSLESFFLSITGANFDIETVEEPHEVPLTLCSNPAKVLDEARDANLQNTLKIDTEHKSESDDALKIDTKTNNTNRKSEDK